MCGRYALGVNLNELPQQFINSVFHSESESYTLVSTSEDHNEMTYEKINHNDEPENIDIHISKASNQSFKPSYNISPTNTAIIIYKGKDSKDSTGCYVIEPSTFGLVPFWAKPKNKSINKVDNSAMRRFEANQFNCRKESLRESKPVWNSAKATRCVVPIEGYYEWHTLGKEKDPYYVHSRTKKLVFLAGIYAHNFNFVSDRVKSNNSYFSSFAIITGPATKEDNKDISWLHSRKPILLEPGTSAWNKWLDSDISLDDKLIDDSLDTKRSVAFNSLEVYRVGKEVGRTNAEGEHLILKQENQKRQKDISKFFQPSKKQRLEVKEEGNDVNL